MIGSPGGGWRPSLGAWLEPGGVRFRVWAPERERVELVLEGPEPACDLARDAAGYWGTFVPDLPVGALYRYLLDDEGPFPDPASRSQPQGVHGPSGVVDPGTFAWSDHQWKGLGLEELVVYELHVGTFTPEGTFAAAREKLAHLRRLGVTAIELMPLADFPGDRNWGYDGVDLFAPARVYGKPDDLRDFVDAAHGERLAVLLDVVYNHLGPDGAYLSLFSPSYFSKTHRTPWGQAVNLDGPASEHVRGFFVENAQHWIHEYHLDGLRLDACHALIDDSPRHLLAELQDRVRSSLPERDVLIIAEDSRNLVRMVQPEAEGGWGLDAVWADDLHHQLRVGMAGDRDGYYADFSGSVQDLARTIRDGWFFRGQTSRHFGGPRGTDPTGAPPRRFVVCLQNHDQVGNRALGERLHHQVDLATWRAASTLLLLGPETPLLFMGQEWGATSPFLFFTDHDPHLGRRVTEGRRREFADFRAFTDPAARARIPDPQAEETFRRSRLDWGEANAEPHRGLRRLYRTLLALRREARLGSLERDQYRVAALTGRGVAVHLEPRGEAGESLLVVACLRSPGPVDLRSVAGELGLKGKATWRLAVSTEEEDYVRDPRPPDLASMPRIRFERPGAVVLANVASRASAR
ncbi:MAG: malto-oligosyltrehalose trehalohydrolase [Acidobacteria bacterium]|nr:malto-oligosyltrehalose trehalohydrolase [Acidobacteriota bacterium]